MKKNAEDVYWRRADALPTFFFVVIVLPLVFFLSFFLSFFLFSFVSFFSVRDDTGRVSSWKILSVVRLVGALAGWIFVTVEEYSRTGFCSEPQQTESGSREKEIVKEGRRRRRRRLKLLVVVVVVFFASNT